MGRLINNHQLDSCSLAQLCVLLKWQRLSFKEIKFHYKMGQHWYSNESYRQTINNTKWKNSTLKLVFLNLSFACLTFARSYKLLHLLCTVATQHFSYKAIQIFLYLDRERKPEVLILRAWRSYFKLGSTQCCSWISKLSISRFI